MDIEKVKNGEQKARATQVLFRPRRPTCAQWWHLDQDGAKRPDLDCIQGALNLLPPSHAGADGGGTALVPGSHLWFERAFASAPSDGGAAAPGHEYVPVSWRDALVLGGAPLSPRLDPGDLLLWDSRTIHCSSPAEPSPRDDRLARAAALVCFTPRAFASPDTIEKRKRAAARGETTTHRPHDCVLTSHHDYYRDAPDDLKRRYRHPPPPTLSDADKRDVGY